MHLLGRFEWDRSVEDRKRHHHGYFITEVNKENMMDEMRKEKIQVEKRCERKKERNLTKEE